MLGASINHQQIPAYDSIYGIFNYNATPIGLPGCHVVTHVKPDKQNIGTPPN